MNAAIWKRSGIAFEPKGAGDGDGTQKSKASG